MARGNPNPKPGPGRPPGLPNKVTVKAREAIAELVDGNAHRMLGWLDEVAKGKADPKDPNKWIVPPNPIKAFELFQSIIEYHIPKLQRTDTTVTGEITVKKVEFVRPEKIIDHDGV